jgi:hypothetical protein
MRFIDYFTSAMMTANVAYNAYLGEYHALGFASLAMLCFAHSLKLERDIRGLRLLLWGDSK